jgi:hypothetical protein
VIRVVEFYSLLLIAQMHLLAQCRNSRRIGENRNWNWGLSSPNSDLCRCSKNGRSKRPPAQATTSRPSVIEAKILGGVSHSCCRLSRARHVRQSPTFRAASSRETCLLLRLPPGLLEEPGCTICEGFVPHIVRFGSVAKASISPKSGPIACIHFAFRIDQIL